MINPLTMRKIRVGGAVHKKLMRSGISVYPQEGGLFGFGKKGKTISGPTKVKRGKMATTPTAALILTAQIESDTRAIESEVSKDSKRLSEISAELDAGRLDLSLLKEVQEMSKRREANIRKLDKLRKEAKALSQFTF